MVIRLKSDSGFEAGNLMCIGLQRHVIAGQCSDFDYELVSRS